VILNCVETLKEDYKLPTTMKRQKISLVDLEAGAKILREAKVPQKVLAFYSSVLGGITTERALMTVPIDDHIVHRGHAVYAYTTTRDFEWETLT